MVRAVVLSFVLLAAAVPVAMASPLLPRYAQDDRAQMDSPGYLAAHPDYRWRVQGLATLARGDAAAAVSELQQAARHADKAAQAVIGELHWHGRGVARDRVEGYAFMALAAERGYPRYVALRDEYRDALTEHERALAGQRADTLLGEYGDAVAKPRLEAALQSSRLRREGVRSRAAFGARPLQGVPGTGMSGGSGIPANGQDDRKHWQPAAYWAWQDSLYTSMRPPRVITIELKPFVRSHPPKRAVLAAER